MLCPWCPRSFCVLRVPFAYPRRGYSKVSVGGNPNRTEFDTTEPTYYHRPMITPTKPQTKEPSCNPQPSICNPQPSICNPQPSICNPQPSIHNPSHAIPAPCLRHSRVGGNPSPLALGKNRQNPTESDKTRQKLVCARTLIPARPRARGTRVLSLRHWREHNHAPPHVTRFASLAVWALGGAQPHTLPHHSRTLTRHSRVGGNLPPQTKPHPPINNRQSAINNPSHVIPA